MNEETKSIEQIRHSLSGHDHGARTRIIQFISHWALEEATADSRRKAEEEHLKHEAEREALIAEKERALTEKKI